MSFIMAAGAVIGVVGGVMKASKASKAKKEAAAAQKKAKKELDAKKKQYEALDTSNLNKNMENKMEDLTVNQKGMELQNQKGQQQRSNIMQNMQGAAGGSGIAALAQTMANQGQLASQQAGASIGMQESQNQMAAARQAGANQLQERQGDARSQDLKYQKISTQLGMASARKGAADKARADAKAQQMSAVGEIGAGATTAAGGMGGGGGGGGVPAGHGGGFNPNTGLTDVSSSGSGPVNASAAGEWINGEFVPF